MKTKINGTSANLSLLSIRRNRLIKFATAPEKHVRSLLEELGESFIFQKGFCTAYRFFIVDFYLRRRKKLCLEIDGPSHDEQLAYDAARDEFLNSVRGFRVVRISNELALSLTKEDLMAMICP